MAKYTIEFDYSIGDVVTDVERHKWQIVRLSIDQYGLQWFFCVDLDTFADPSRWLANRNLVPWTEGEGD